MISINPKEIEIPKLHRYLLGSIGPRPIAFASTIDEHGNANLAPFSFFNVFSSNPPILIFSPARRVRDNTTKHTLQNAADGRTQFQRNNLTRVIHDDPPNRSISHFA